MEEPKIDNTVGDRLINIAHMSVPRENKETELITAALIMDHEGQMAAYVGIGRVEFIERHGTKLRYQQAQAWFPMLREEDYRK